MQINESIKYITEFGILIFIAAVSIMGVVYYFMKMEPRLQQIEANQIHDSANHKAQQEIIKNNSDAMKSMADSNANVAHAIDGLTTAMESNNKINERMLNYIIDDNKKVGD